MNNPYATQTHQYLEKQIQNASPAEQVVMLYDGAIKWINRAKQAIDEGDIESRHNANQRAINIVSYLMGILDDNKGGELSARLFKIYGHILSLLVQIDMKNSHIPADEALGHLMTLRKSWAQLAKPEAYDTTTQKEEDPTEGKSSAQNIKRTAIA